MVVTVNWKGDFHLVYGWGEILLIYIFIYHFCIPLNFLGIMDLKKIKRKAIHTKDHTYVDHFEIKNQAIEEI